MKNAIESLAEFVILSETKNENQLKKQIHSAFVNYLAERAKREWHRRKTDKFWSTFLQSLPHFCLPFVSSSLVKVVLVSLGQEMLKQPQNSFDL